VAGKKKVKSNYRKSRTLARLMIVQALYQMQLADHEVKELLSQCRERDDYKKIDKIYFTQAIRTIYKSKAEFLAGIEVYLDRSISQIDPIEMGILLLGYYELEMKREIDIGVIINEAVNLAKRFGSLDGHKYINAVLDRAAKVIRAA